MVLVGVLADAVGAFQAGGFAVVLTQILPPRVLPVPFRRERAAGEPFASSVTSIDPIK